MTIKPNCIIAARGGSKRITNKNIIKIFGQPMISYPITTAIKSRIFKNIFVSTDSKKIKIISEKYGAKVPFLRKKKLANDKVGLQEVLVDFIKSNNFCSE
jgi:CMP-N-acetylneuraminic acid synthetase